MKKEGYKFCVRCSNTWKSRVKDPKCCSRCKSYDWDIPRDAKKLLKEENDG